jgi:hypothetical protein
MRELNCLPPFATPSASSIEEFSYFLKNKLLKTKGVKSTVTSVVLKAYTI